MIIDGVGLMGHDDHTPERDRRPAHAARRRPSGRRCCCIVWRRAGSAKMEKFSSAPACSANRSARTAQRPRAAIPVLRRWLAQGRIVSFCPEVAGGSEPRGRGRSGAVRVVSETGLDVTGAFASGAALAVRWRADTFASPCSRMAPLVRQPPGARRHVSGRRVEGAGVTPRRSRRRRARLQRMRDRGRGRLRVAAGEDDVTGAPAKNARSARQRPREFAGRPAADRRHQRPGVRRLGGAGAPGGADGAPPRSARSGGQSRDAGDLHQRQLRQLALGFPASSSTAPRKMSRAGRSRASSSRPKTTTSC